MAGGAGDLAGSQPASAGMSATGMSTDECSAWRARRQPALALAAAVVTRQHSSELSTPLNVCTRRSRLDIHLLAASSLLHDRNPSRSGAEAAARRQQQHGHAAVHRENPPHTHTHTHTLPATPMWTHTHTHLPLLSIDDSTARS